jgi:hypothetical protein
LGGMEQFDWSASAAYLRLSLRLMARRDQEQMLPLQSTLV